MHASLGPDLYAGTAGVALVLARIHAACGGQEQRRTALGAIRHALRRAADIPSTRRLGLYSGAAGVALAATLVAEALDEPEPAERADALLADLERDGPATAEFDLVSGPAGAIVALCRLAGLGDEDDHRLTGWAARLGRGLLSSARRRPAGLSWSSPSIPASDDLTGLSHGASGGGLALLELHRATQEPQYRDAALAAFGYERGLFDPGARNWPDLRAWDDLPAARRFAVGWCHGAPGIALARLRAVELLGDDACRGDALAALATTRAALRAELDADAGDLTPCHGLSGNAEVLLWSADLLGDRSDEDRALAHAVADVGIERFATAGRPWPCGVQDAESPGLMTGLAGIALFYLRLDDPTVPSALFIRDPAR